MGCEASHPGGGAREAVDLVDDRAGTAPGPAPMGTRAEMSPDSAPEVHAGPDLGLVDQRRGEERVRDVEVTGSRPGVRAPNVVRFRHQPS